MTVQQLIDGLRKYNPDLPVKFEVPAETSLRYNTMYDVENFNVHFKKVNRYLGSVMEPDFLILKDNSQ